MFLGLDLGSSFGYAVLESDGNIIDSGTWKLGKRSGQASSRLHSLIQEAVLMFNVHYVGYEKVRRHRGVAAAHAYGGYENIIMMSLHDSGFDIKNIYPLSVQEIKRAATGKGKADKELMEYAAMERWCFYPEDDNEADALWCAECLRQKVSNAK